MKKKSIFKNVEVYKNLSVGDRVMKKSGKPFLFVSTSSGHVETFLFTGYIHKIQINQNNKAVIKIKNGQFHIGDIHYEDIELIDSIKLSNCIKIWRKINRLAESICFDFRFSCFTNFTNVPKEKQKFTKLIAAFLAAYTLQSKNNSKKYVVYKCSNCDHYHVGSELENDDIIMVENNMLPLIGLS